MTNPTKAAFSEELWKVSRKYAQAFDARVRAKGLTLARARALIFLGKKDCMTQTELADALEIEGPTLVPLLDGLEKQGLIERRPVDGDRRASRSRSPPPGVSRPLMSMPSSRNSAAMCSKASPRTIWRSPSVPCMP